MWITFKSMYGQRKVIALLFILTIIQLSLGAQNKTASGGIIDFSSFSGLNEWKQTLAGEWDFYWEQLLLPEDFSRDPLPAGGERIAVPGNWNRGNNHPAHGYATLRLRISGLEKGRVYSLYVPEMLTAFRLFLNGREVYGNGRVGRNSSESSPRFLPGLVSFQSTGETAELVCQISNFDHRNSGIWRTPVLGTEQLLQKERKSKLLLEMFIAAVLFTISLFHMGLFIYRKEAMAELLFGLTCLILFIRTITTGEQLLAQLIPAFPWDWTRKLEYSPFYAVSPLFLAFLTSLFPDEAVKAVNRFFYVIFAIMAVFFLTVPVRISNHGIIAAELILVITIFYALSILIRALAAARPHSLPIVAAFLILALAAVNDILFSRRIIPTMYLAPAGFILFIIIQSQMLTSRYARSFREVKDLTHRLQELNESLSRFVPFQFLEYLKKNSILDVQLGDQVLQEMTILFADIRSFTSLSEAMTPEENFRFLNSFLSQVVPVIRQQGGFVDKFIGDGIMALFPYPPDKAVRAALELQKAVREYNEARNRAGYREIALGIGIHTGQLMLGTIGETNRMETTVIADTVNIASRLENLTKTYGARIIISRDLFEKMEDRSDITSRSLGRSPVKGKAEPLEIVEILDNRDGRDDRKVDSLGDFEEAVDLMRRGDYSRASSILDSLIETNPGDIALHYFRENCRSHLNG